jgi:hypothetical protein
MQGQSSGSQIQRKLNSHLRTIWQRTSCDCSSSMAGCCIETTRTRLAQITLQHRGAVGLRCASAMKSQCTNKPSFSLETEHLSWLAFNPVRHLLPLSLKILLRAQ